MVKQKLEPIKNWHNEKELLAVGFFEGLKGEKLIGSELGKKILADLSNGNHHVKDDFKGKFGQKALIYEMYPKRVLFVGLGKAKDFNQDLHREISKQVACYVRNSGIKSYSIEIFGDFSDELGPSRVKTQLEAQSAGLYRFSYYKKPENEIQEIKILVRSITPEVEKAFNQGIIVAENLWLVRDLINAPAVKMTPQHLAYTAHNIGGNKIKVEIWEKGDLANKGMNLILAVGTGSENGPKLITMEYKPENHQNEKPYVLVGKGVCFDSGGLQIKNDSAMIGMHTDMSGAAAVIGTLKTIAEIDLPLWVVGLVPAVENMPSSASYKPGDIIKAYNGKTIEIAHTDAEGRLILFDAMAYAKEKYDPCLVVDIATLTGACKVALGEHYAGLFGNSKEFLKKIKEAGETSGDKVWELPLGEEYLKEMKSEVANLKNSGSRWAGASTAACFLQEAVGEKQPWIHLDIAGAGRIDVVGQATGFGLKLFVQFFLNELK